MVIAATLLLASCTAARPPAAAAASPSVPATAVPAVETIAPATGTAWQTATPGPTSTKTETPTPAYTPTVTPTATPDTRLLPKDWGSWPPVPAVSANAVKIYLRGIQLGNNPRAFSTIGDCQSETNVFMGIYETDRYNLGRYGYLQATIDYYRGSFGRKSAAVKDGMSVASVLNPMWNDPEQCKPDETPVNCELRVNKPAVMFINLGTNWKNGSARSYEKYLRQIVQIVIDNGTLPILTTKADNIEGDNSLNLATAQVAYDFDVPLMNFWLASNDLPNHGLDATRDNIYLTPQAWDRRNFTALLTLDTAWKVLMAAYDPASGLPAPTP